MNQDQEKAMRKFAQRLVSGYEAVHERDYNEALENLEPLVPLFHQEEKPNIKLLSYLAMAQLGARKVEDFLSTCEELAKHEPKTKQDVLLKGRVDEMFDELMEVLNDQM